jgi:uncharacterized protein YneR
MKNFLLLSLALISLNVNALTVDSISFEDKVTVDAKELVLNGVGIRKATFLKIKVYYGGLYIPVKTDAAHKFLTTAEPKQIVMHFVRDVGVKDLKKGFSEGFENANKDKANYKELLAKLEQFNGFLQDVSKGDRMIVTFHADGVTLSLKGKTSEKISAADFSQALLAVWFVNPIDESLAKGLLGS